MRDLATYKHLPGVTSGDIGAKVGYQSKDNGWARFDQVRIPRMNMMMGIVSVSKEGKFEMRKDQRVLYTTMMLIRYIIIHDVPVAMNKSLLIALRYAACRRQFRTIKGSKEERKILDYQTF